MPNFLFVNKTQASSHLTHGEASETTAIQHFVQKGRKRARKAKLVSRFKVCPLLLETAKKSEPDLDKEEAIKDSAKPAADTQARLDRSSQEVPLDGTKSLAPSQFCMPSLCRNISGAIDPFKATAITVDSSIQCLINYYTTVYHPTLWPNESIALKRGGYIFENAVNHVVQASLLDGLTMYCLLTAAVSRMRHVDHLPMPEATRSKENEYMNQALRLMQERIDQAAQKRGINLLYLLSSMVFLSAAEAYRDDLGASKTHLKACVSLLAHHGMSIIDVTDQNLQGQLLMSDLFLSCVNLEACLFSADDYDPGAVTVLDLQPSELDRLPHDLTWMAASLSHNRSISLEVKFLISQIQETYTTKRCLDTTTMTSSRAMQTTHWITKRSMAIRNRLLSVFLPRKSSSGSMSTGALQTPAEELLNKVLRIALIQFTLLSMNITGRIKTVKVMSRRLQTLLAPLLVDRSDVTDGQTELLLWLAVVGYSCAQDGSENEEWFADRCHELIDDCEALHGPSHDGESDDDDDDDGVNALLERLEQVQNRYFYHEQVQRPRLRKLIHGTWSRSPEKLGDGILAQRMVPHV